MNFDSIIGQKQVISALTVSIVNDKVGHAYLFTGPFGIGKRTLASIFAGVLLCQNLENQTMCEKCQSCRLYLNESNPDFCIIGKESSSITIDMIRDMQSQIFIRPLYSKRKVYLIVDAHRMTIQAQNCLLKTLEEPPSYAVIIMTTSNYDALLETIRSRIVRYNFKKNTRDEVIKAIKRTTENNLKTIDFIVSYSDGIIGNALNMIESGEIISLRDKVIDIIVKLLRSKMLDVFIFYKFFEDNKNDIDTILNIMVLFYRDLLITKKDAADLLLINDDKSDIIIDAATNIDFMKILDSIELIEQTRKSLKQNINFQLAIEVMLMKLQEEYKW